MKTVKIILNVAIAVMAIVAAGLILYGISLFCVSVIYDVFRYYLADSFTRVGAVIFYVFFVGVALFLLFARRKDAAERRSYIRKRINDERLLIKHQNVSTADLYRVRGDINQILAAAEEKGVDIDGADRYERLWCRREAIEEELMERE